MQVALADTVPAEASPWLETSRETVKDCAVLTTAGAIAFAVSCAGAWTETTGCPRGAVDTAAPVFASMPRACNDRVSMPGERAKSVQK